MIQMSEREKDQVRAERQRIIKKRVEDSKLIDPPIKVRFQNIEDPPSPGRPSPPLNFTFNQYTFRESSDEGVPDTALRDGETYDLPVSVVDHLNSLRIPVTGHITDPSTKALKTIIVGHNNRFACVPVNAAAYQALENEPKKGRGRPKEE